MRSPISSARSNHRFAHFAALGAERELCTLIDYIHTRHPDIPVILDAKRGDMGATAERYAIEAFDRYRADAVTVNPYLGPESLRPFLRAARSRRDRAVPNEQSRECVVAGLSDR